MREREGWDSWRLQRGIDRERKQIYILRISDIELKLHRYEDSIIGAQQKYVHDFQLHF